VSPLASAFSDYSRGFALSRLGLLIALWACARLATGGERRWWWLCAAGAIVAVWSEYDPVLFLFCLLAAMLLLRARPWRETLLLRLAPMATLALWLHQLFGPNDRGLFGIGVPSFTVAAELLFAPVGLLRMTPLVGLGLVRTVLTYRRGSSPRR
jgi:hypothetical protein